MTVVPFGGNITAPLLGWAPTDLCGLAFGVDEDELLFLVDVAAAVADVAAGAGALPELATAALEPEPVADAEEPDVPPHAASSSTRDPIPVAAAHPLLRINCLHSRKNSHLTGPSRSEP